MRRPLLPVLLLVLALTTPAVAQAASAVAQAATPSARTPEGDKAVMATVIEAHITPRVRAFASASAALAPTVAELCAKPDAATLDDAQGAFKTAALAWAGVAHIRPGPLLLDGRADRIAFWPDKRGIGARQLARALAKKDEALLAPGALGQQSAAIQGFPALERLLWDDVTPASLTGPDGGYRCRLAVAIASHLATLAAETRDGWAALAPQILANQPTPVGDTVTAAINNLHTSLITAAQIVSDQKLLIPLGASAGEARPTLVEWRFSALSLEALRATGRGIAAMALGAPGEGEGLAALAPATPEAKAARATTKAAFDAADRALAVPTPLDQAVVDADKRKAIEAAFRAAKAAHAALARDLAPHLGIVLGFNELDGD